jgi:hypothetical protein
VASQDHSELVPDTRSWRIVDMEKDRDERNHLPVDYSCYLSRVAFVNNDIVRVQIVVPENCSSIHLVRG